MSILVPTAAVAGDPVTVQLENTAAALPASVSSQLTNVAAISLKATLTTQGAGGQAISIVGSSGTPQNPLTSLPPIGLATGTVTFPKAGTSYVDTPPATVVFTPEGAGTTTYPPITCDPIAASILGDPVAVSAPPTAATSGPEYACTNSAPDGAPFDGHLPLTVAVSGTKTIGATDTVTLTSPTTGLGGPYPAGTTSLTYSGNLAVTGAQSGAIALSGTTADVTSPTFTVSGKVMLAATGTDHVLLPATLKFTAQDKSGDLVDLTCTSATSPAPVAATFTVTRSGTVVPPPTPTATPSAAGSGTTGTSGTTTGQGVPVGAPATGGGRAPGDSLPLIGAAAAILLAGAGTLVGAVRRRQRGHAS